MRLRRLVSLGSMLVGVCLLLAVLLCSVGAVAVHQRLVAAPNLDIRIGDYRIAGYPISTGGVPPQQYYSIWLFVTTARTPVRARPIERGEQLILLPLRRD